MINNCYYNINGKCTNPEISHNKPTAINGSGRSWDSMMNCTFTQYGAQKICSKYKLQD